MNLHIEWINDYAIRIVNDLGVRIAEGEVNAMSPLFEHYGLELPAKPTKVFPTTPGSLVLVNDSYYALRGRDGLWYVTLPGVYVEEDDPSIDKVVEGGYDKNLSPSVAGELQAQVVDTASATPQDKV